LGGLVPQRKREKRRLRNPRRESLCFLPRPNRRRQKPWRCDDRRAARFLLRAVFPRATLLLSNRLAVLPPLRPCFANFPLMQKSCRSLLPAIPPHREFRFLLQ